MLPSLPIPGTWSLRIYSSSGSISNTPDVNLLTLVGKARVPKIDFEGRNGGDFKKVFHSGIINSHFKSFFLIQSCLESLQFLSILILFACSL